MFINTNKTGHMNPSRVGYLIEFLILIPVFHSDILIFLFRGGEGGLANFVVGRGVGDKFLFQPIRRFVSKAVCRGGGDRQVGESENKQTAAWGNVLRWRLE